MLEDTFESMEDDDLEEVAQEEVDKILFEVTKGIGVVLVFVVSEVEEVSAVKPAIVKMPYTCPPHEVLYVNILYMKNLLGIMYVEALSNTLWFVNSTHFRFKGCQEQ